METEVTRMYSITMSEQEVTMLVKILLLIDRDQLSSEESNFLTDIGKSIVATNDL